MVQNSVLPFIFCFLCIAFISSDLYGQDTDQNENPYSINLDEIDNDSRRIEIQRYFGYEDLLSRYLTLPYDISSNTSNQGRYFDIGFLLMILLPLSLLVITYKQPRLFYSVLIILILYLAFSFNYSFINVNGVGPASFSSDTWNIVGAAPMKSNYQSLLITIYESAGIIAFPIVQLVKSVSGQTDHVTYIILFTLFAGLILFATRALKWDLKWSIISVVLIAFGFLWLILSGGIIWYGFFILPLAYAVAFRAFRTLRSENSPVFSFLGMIALACISFWTLLSYSARISNLDVIRPSSADMGKAIINPQLVYYTTGIHTPNESRNALYRRNSNVFDIINSNNELIYQVGTSMAFEIKNNPYRIYQDNTLIDFYNLINVYRDKNTVIEVMKTSGYKYIIVDLFTHTLDKTPEQSLVKKYQLFLNALYDNPGVRLLATDRIIELSDSNGQVQLVNNVFNPPDMSNLNIRIRDFGSYAVYEII